MDTGFFNNIVSFENWFKIWPALFSLMVSWWPRNILPRMGDTHPPVGVQSTVFLNFFVEIKNITFATDVKKKVW